MRLLAIWAIVGPLVGFWGACIIVSTRTAAERRRIFAAGQSYERHFGPDVIPIEPELERRVGT